MEKSQIIDISIVIPLYNEETTFPVLYNRLKQSLDSISKGYEIIFVNDGSYDNTLNLIKEYSKKDINIKYISFSRNFGHQNAIFAGIKYACGEVIITMDGDLQDPPEIINELYNKYKEGYQVVYAKRKTRKGESVFKKTTAKIFYRLLKKITAIDIPLDTGDFRLISNKVSSELIKLDEKNKFIRGQIAWLGFKQTSIEFERQERYAGKTKYSFKKMINLAFDGITSFSNFPLQIATIMGVLFSFIAFLIILYALYSKFILHRVVTGWTSLMLSSMFLGGIQLLCIGIIGEYISRINNDVKKRPSFIVEESNIDNSIG